MISTMFHMHSGAQMGTMPWALKLIFDWSHIDKIFISYREKLDVALEQAWTVECVVQNVDTLFI